MSYRRHVRALKELLQALPLQALLGFYTANLLVNTILNFLTE